MFMIEFQKIDYDIIDVRAGQKIDIMVKTSRDGQSDVRFNYGYDGYHPENIEGQDHDFDVEYSDHNQNSSSKDFGQFPYILYAK